jgi:hypothetical protein
LINRNKIWFVLTVLVMGASAAFAQLSTGSVTGLVTDPTKSGIPGAKIVLVNQENGLILRAETDTSGRYLIRAVPPATYTLSAEATSFQTEKRPGLAIDVNQIVTMDFALPLATNAQAITITDQLPLLASEDASTGQVLNREFIDALPVVGRDTMALSYLAPGVVGALNGTVKTGQSGNDFSSSGGPAWTADVLLDGISMTNYEQNGGLIRIQYLPSPDAIEEFKVQTSNFNAEFGFTGATVINMVMRSGTNSFHSTSYDYLRNSVLDSNNFFANKAGTKIAALRRNNFGANLGGPIKKNKTFFFADYDGLRQSAQANVNFGVPSSAERNGNFSELCGENHGTFNAMGQCSAKAGQLWDPYTGVYNSSVNGAVRSTYIPFNNLATYQSPGNPNLNGTGYQLPATPGNLIDPVSKKLIQYMPLPNVGVGTPSYQYFNNYFAAGTASTKNDMTDAKIDHRFSDMIALSAKFGFQRPVTHKYNAFGNAADPSTSGTNDTHEWMSGLNYTQTLSPTLLFTASYGFTRVWEHVPSALGDYPNVNPITTLGLPAYMAASGVLSFPAVSLGTPYSDGPNGVSVGTNPSTFIVQGEDQHQALASLSWTRGSHEFKVGAEMRWHRVNYFIPASPGGVFSFGFGGSAQTSTSSTSGGDAMASFLMGVGSGNSGSYEVPSAYTTTNWQWGGFLQDNWKVTPSLTLNIGLRYDLTVPRTERWNRANYFDPTAASPLQVQGLGPLQGGEVFATPQNPRIYDTDYGNIQPRFGLAWKLGNKTVIRSGYGIYYTASRVAASGAGGPGHAGNSQVTTWVTSYNNDGATPWGRLSDPFPGTGPALPPGNSLGLLNDIGLSAAGPYRNQNATPYEQSWDFDIQRELPGGVLLDVAYLGKKGTHLYFGGDTNYNILPTQIANESPSQIASLTSYVKNPFYGIITNPLSTLSKSTVQAYQLLLPFPQFTNVGGDSPPEANSSYNGLQMRVEKRMSGGLQILGTYTFSKAIDDASVSQDSFNTGSTSLQDPNNRRLERGLSLFNDTQVFQFSHVYELPFGHGRKFGSNWNPVVNTVLGGWRVTGIWTFDSGRPLSPTLTGSVSIPTYGTQRPNLSGTPVRNTGPNSLNDYFVDNSVFSKPAAYTLGDAPRTLSGVFAPGQANSNLSVSKEFSLSSLKEGMRLQLMAQSTNALNHPQFSAPNLSVGSAAFGTTTSVANTPREIEMALKLRF